MKRLILVAVLLVLPIGDLFALPPGIPTEWPSDLRIAVKATETVNELSAINRGFFIREFAAWVSFKAILASLMNKEEWELANTALIATKGDGAVQKLAQEWRNEAKKLNTSGKIASAKAYQDVAKAMESAFVGMQDLVKTQVVEPSIAKAGGTKYIAVLAKKQDGSWFVLCYFIHPS